MSENPFAPHLLIEARGSVRVVTLNKPETLNAIDPEIHAAVAGVWAHLEEDEDARAVVLTGAGRAFSAGGDMEMFRRLQTERVERRALLDTACDLVHAMLDFPLPVVAAVNGPAVGLGCSLAILSDIVYMAESAFIADPHVAVGLTAGDGGAIAWPFAMSLLRAKEYLFTGDQIDSRTAVELGLANRVVPDDTVLADALELAQRLAGLPPQALQTTKRTVNLHVSRAISGILEYALAAEYESFDTPEHQAQVDRFLARS